MAKTGRTVVVVDDDASIRQSISRLLETAGFEPLPHVSAEAMLGEARWTDAACIVSDLKLPGASGLELLAELRRRGATVPFVLITAHHAPSVRDEALRRGAAAYLVKPFRGTELLAVIEKSRGEGT